MHHLDTMSKNHLIKFLLPVLLLAILFFSTDLRSLLGQFAGLSWFWIAYLMIISVLLVYISALKWGLFIEHYGEEVSAFRLFSLYLLGYFVNLILPSYLGGDAVRSFKIGKTLGQHRAAAATILERYTGLTAMVLLGLGCMWASDKVGTPIRFALAGLTVAIAIVTLVALNERLLGLARYLPFGARIAPHLGKLHDALVLSAQAPKLLVKAYLLSFLFHSVTVVNTMMCGIAIGWLDVQYTTLFVVLPIILLIGAIPISPQGLGIQEGAFFFFLQSAGATPEQALGVALVLRAKSYILALCGGIVWYLEPAIGASRPPEGSAHQEQSRPLKRNN